MVVLRCQQKIPPVRTIHINHSPGLLANAKLAKPILMNGKLKLGIVASRDIEEGEETMYDYGVRGQKCLRTPGMLFERASGK